MLWKPDDNECVSYKNAMRIHHWDEDNDVYVVAIASSVLFHLTIKFITLGMSFKRTALAVQAAKEETSCAKLGGVSELKVTTFARLQCALNFQVLASVLRLQWAFALALDGSTCLDTSCIDVRIRFVWQGRM